MNTEFWDDKYSSSEELYGKEPNEFFKGKIQSIPCGKILIPGEGEGRNAIHAARLGWEVTAFDMSAVGQKHALKKAYSLGLNLNYQLNDAETFDYEREIYVCAALIYFHLLPKIRIGIHQKITDSVKPGGHLILEGFSLKQLGLSSGGPKNKGMLYTSGQLEMDFSKWEILDQFEGKILLKEGVGHSGPAEIIRLFARKK